MSKKERKNKKWIRKSIDLFGKMKRDLLKFENEKIFF